MGTPSTFPLEPKDVDSGRKVRKRGANAGRKEVQNIAAFNAKEADL
jgi:hypothetical protein